MLRWLVWVAELLAPPLVSFLCFSFSMRDWVCLSPAMLLGRMRGYVKTKKKCKYELKYTRICGDINAC